MKSSGDGRDTLGRRLMSLVYAKRSAVIAIRKWKEEGHTIRKYGLNRIVRQLRKLRRYKHALEVHLPSAKANNDNNTDLFTSLISDIKSCSGNDPLLPWLRGIRKMKDLLPSQVLNEKLPWFLQNCAQTFDFDRRYKNDLR